MKHVIPLVLILLAPVAASAQELVAHIPVPASQPMPDIISFRNNPQLFRLDSFMLRIPFVDQGDIPGLYQDVTIEYLPQNSYWRLSGYTRAVPIEDIDSVDLVITTARPVQAFLDITGKLTNGCLQVGQVGMRNIGEAFSVYLFYQPFRPDCVGTADVRSFRKVVPLDVYGLRAGTYTWTVNGRFSGSFVLAADNVLD